VLNERGEEFAAPEVSVLGAGGRPDSEPSQAAVCSGRWPGVLPRLAWTGAVAVAAVALFWCYLRQSQTTGVDSDAASQVLQGWDMMHGNWLLSGWFVSDVSFYTFEVPVDGLAALAHGLGPDAAHIGAAIVYTLLVLTAALLAKGTARGAEGVVRAVLAGGILMAPGYIPGSQVLLLSPDHTGIGVPILLTLLLVDRAVARGTTVSSHGGLGSGMGAPAPMPLAPPIPPGPRTRLAQWLVPVGVAVLLTWAQVDDPLATYAAAAPMAVVCLARAGLPLLRRRPDGRQPGRPGWYDLGLAVAAGASVGLTRLAERAIEAAGGWTMHALKVQQSVPVSAWGHQLKITAQNVLILFGADFFDQPTWTRTLIALVHLAGVALALAGLLAGIGCLFRGADRVTQILTVGTLTMLAGGAFRTHTVFLESAHEIAVVLPFGAVLAGRTVGPWLARRRRPRITLAPVLVAVLGCYLAALGYSVTRPALPAGNQSLTDWLVARHLTGGLGTYWTGANTTLSSGGQVQVAPMHNDGTTPFTWIAESSWFDPAVSRATFVIATPGSAGDAYSLPETRVEHAFGAPAHEYHVGQYLIMVYDKNLLSQVKKPGPV
jgi:hypothetical protein